MVTAFGRPSFVRTAAVFVKLSFIRRAKSGVSVSCSNDFAMTMPFYAAAKALKFPGLLGFRPHSLSQSSGILSSIAICCVSKSVPSVRGMLSINSSNEISRPRMSFS